MAQEQTTKQTGTTEDTQETEAKDLKNQELTDDVDAMLDEIDDVLEENAEEFVKGYIQKGGE
jgi:prokaryotic ubiquitin-like protein Pup